MNYKENQNKIKDSESFLERIKRFIPGYNGYVDKDNARELDTILRNAIVAKLERNKQKIINTVSNMSRNKKLFEYTNMDKIEKKNETVIAKFKTVARGYSGAFDIIKIKDDKLSKLYEFDESLLINVDRLELMFNKLVLLSSTNNDIKVVIADISDSLEALINKFDERNNILKEL